MNEFVAENANWLVPAVVLVMGAILGVILSRDGGSEAERRAVSLEGRRNDLESQREVVVAALKQLEQEKSKLTDAEYTAERAKLVKWGADVLRALDGGQSSEADAALAAEVGLSKDFKSALASELARLGREQLASAVGDELGVSVARRATPGMSPEWRGAMWTLLAIGAASTLFFIIAQSSQPRVGENPMTGRQGSSANAQRPGQVDDSKKEAELKAKLAEDANDLDALNGLTEMAFVSRDLGRAMDYNRRAMTAHPADKTARTYKAVLRSSVGMNDEALGLLEEVLTEDPEFKTALVYQGLIAMDVGNPELAVAALERALADGPPNQFLEGRLAAARRASSAETVLSGTITLADGVEPPSQGMIYISVRSPAGGPPLAAVQLPAGPFPQSFEVTTANAIAMGGRARPFPDELLVKIKVDTDGNAMTTEPGAPVAELPGVSKGSEGLEVVLKP